MKHLSGTYSEMDLVKNDSAQAKQNRDSGRSIKLNGREWDETVQRLSVTFDRSGSNRVNARRCSHGAASPWSQQQQNQSTSTQRGVYNSSVQTKNAGAQGYERIPIGKPGALQEDENRYYATAVIEGTKDHLKLATVFWVKEPFESWIVKAENQAPTPIAAPGGNYTLPEILGGGCIEDSWTATNGPPDARANHTAVWTGSEMIVWGGTRHPV